MRAAELQTADTTKNHGKLAPQTFNKTLSYEKKLVQRKRKVN